MLSHSSGDSLTGSLAFGETQPALCEILQSHDAAGGSGWTTQQRDMSSPEELLLRAQTHAEEEDEKHSSAVNGGSFSFLLGALIVPFNVLSSYPGHMLVAFLPRC